MTKPWLEGFTRRDVTNRYPPKRSQLGRPHRKPVDTIVLHSTEGSTAQGAFGAYDTRAGRYTGGVHPHFTADSGRRERYQHIPLTAGSYSLVRGDTDGVIQIERVGFARHGWPPEEDDWFGANVIAPIVKELPGIPLIAPAEFLGPSAGTLALPWPRGKARMSPTRWATVAGIVGHQHAPYDNHWDPGAIDIDRVLLAAEVELMAQDLIIPDKENRMGTRLEIHTDPVAKKTWAMYGNVERPTVDLYAKYVEGGESSPSGFYIVRDAVRAGRMTEVGKESFG